MEILKKDMAKTETLDEFIRMIMARVVYILLFALIPMISFVTTKIILLNYMTPSVICAIIGTALCIFGISVIIYSWEK